MGRLTPREFKLKNERGIVVRNAGDTDAAQLISLTTAVIEEGRFMITMPHEFEVGLKEEREWIRFVPHSSRQIADCFRSRRGIGWHARLSQWTAAADFAPPGTLGMSVRRDWRRLGVGRALLTVLLDWAALNPLIHKVSLSVLSDNTAASCLYRGMGFVEEGRRKDEIQMETGEFRDDILMCLMVKRR